MHINPYAFLVERFSTAVTILCLAALAFLPACALAPAEPTPQAVYVVVLVDGKQNALSLPAGSTVEDALKQAGVELSNLDQVVPPVYTRLEEQGAVRVIRVRETFEIEEQVLPYQRQILRNESLPEGQTRLVQPGKNGLQQVTYRQVFQDEAEGPRTVFKVLTLQEAQPEIVMVGVQAPYTAVSIEGVLAYISGGNAWIMEGDTGARRVVVNDGDLDGRVFSLSADRSWLLYTRKTSADEEAGAINSLWAISLAAENAGAIPLRAQNIVHFADWVPRPGLSVAYSTVEPRQTPPGWQANNDLHRITFSQKGTILKTEEIIEASFGGIYGWWGTSYAWSPDGEKLAYARPDGIGLVDWENGELLPLLKLLPYQTRSDWAWVPGLAWSPDQASLYTVNHVPLSGAETDESSPLFDILSVGVTDAQQHGSFAAQTGMFAYPAPSPLFSDNQYRVAYLQAIFPEKSESSRYRLKIADPDGSNAQALYPPEGAAGLDPQRAVWGPSPVAGEPSLAIVYEGNLWLITPGNGQAQQITGDGSVGKIDWK